MLTIALKKKEVIFMDWEDYIEPGRLNDCQRMVIRTALLAILENLPKNKSGARSEIEEEIKKLELDEIVDIGELASINDTLVVFYDHFLSKRKRENVKIIVKLAIEIIRDAGEGTLLWREMESLSLPK